MDALAKYAVQGSRVTDNLVEINEQVTLRLVSFENPANEKTPAILFVAGWVSQISAWQEVLIELTKNYDVHYLETREKISSQNKGRVEYGVEDIASDIVTVIRKSGFSDDRYCIMGSSLGATAIVNSCLSLSLKPLAIILIAPNAVFRVPAFWMPVIYAFHPRFYFLLKPVIKWYLKNFRLSYKSDPQQYEKYCTALDAADPWKLKKGILRLRRYKIWDILPQVNYPALIIGASKDALHEPENLKKMASMMPKATYLDLETNKNTHSKLMVDSAHHFIQNLWQQKQ